MQHPRCLIILTWWCIGGHKVSELWLDRLRMDVNQAQLETPTVAQDNPKLKPQGPIPTFLNILKHDVQIDCLQPVCGASTSDQVAPLLLAARALVRIESGACRAWWARARGVIQEFDHSPRHKISVFAFGWIQANSCSLCSFNLQSHWIFLYVAHVNDPRSWSYSVEICRWEMCEEHKPSRSTEQRLARHFCYTSLLLCSWFAYRSLDDSFHEHV